MLYYEQDRLAEVVPLFTRIREVFPAISGAFCALAFIHTKCGELEEARRLLEPLAAKGSIAHSTSPGLRL